VNGPSISLERTVEAALTVGIVAASLLFLVGFSQGMEGALRTGILILMGTPVLRVLIISAGLLRKRDWLFGLASVFVLSVLASSAFMAFRR
jgi:uncharacterized membrane protein